MRARDRDFLRQFDAELVFELFDFVLQLLFDFRDRVGHAPSPKKIRGGGIWKVRMPPPRNLKYRCDEIAGTSRDLPRSIDFHGYLLGDALPVRAACRKSISCGFCWHYVDTKIVRRPDFVGLWL